MHRRVKFKIDRTFSGRLPMEITLGSDMVCLEFKDTSELASFVNDLHKGKLTATFTQAGRHAYRSALEFV